MSPNPKIADEPWIAPTTAIVAVIIAVAVGLQRDAFTHPGRQTLFVAVATLPWLVDAVTRRFPRWLWVVLVVGASTAMFGWYPANVDYAPFFLVFLAGTMATVLETRPGIAVAVLAASSGVTLDLAGRVTGSVIWVFGITMAWFFGYGFRAQLKLLHQLEDAQSTLAESAATSERQRLARELHDLIAHSLSVTMLHVTGARMALDDGDVDEARAGLAQAEHTGREAMTEIRRTVGLLGPGSPTAPPAPTATDIGALFESFRDAGMSIDVTIEGDLGIVAPAPGLAVYRVVQESLTNVVKHASSRHADVRIDVAPSGVGIEVRSAADTAALRGCDGLGVRGMHDRVDVLGGTLTAGRRDGAWVVTATVPL